MAYYFAPSMSSSPYFWQRSPWLYIKWGKPKRYPGQRNHGKKGTWFQLPDREVIVCHESERPQGCNIDEAIDLNPMTSPLYDHVKYFLIGQGSGSRPSPHHNWHRPGYEVICDSGGAQLRTGKGWVDPVRSMEFMNLSGDIGVVLDLPLRGVDGENPARFSKILKAQKRINDWMLSAKRDDLKLLNVVHGFTVQQFREWYEAVAGDAYAGVAIGGYWQLALAATMNKHQHIHCLGFGSLYPSVAWIGKNVPLVTSDSATWAMVFRNSNVNFQATAHGSFEYTMFGGDKRYKNHQFIIRSRLPCSCPICSKLGWFYPFLNARSGDVKFLVANHVLLTQFHQADVLNKLAYEAKTVEEYVDKLVQWYGGTAPDNTPKAQKRNHEQYDPRFCAFCGRDSDKGRGGFPCCKGHSRVADYISDVKSAELVLRDPGQAEVLWAGGAESKKTGAFKVTQLFSGPSQLFAKRKGTHIIAAASKVANESALPLAERLSLWLDGRSHLCRCFEPDMKLTGTGKDPTNPTTPPYTAECTKCNKQILLPKGNRKASKKYIVKNGSEVGRFATLKECLELAGQTLKETKVKVTIEKTNGAKVRWKMKKGVAVSVRVTS